MSVPSYACELCGDEYPSARAAILCEDRCLAEEKDARRPVRAVMRPAAFCEDD